MSDFLQEAAAVAGQVRTALGGGGGRGAAAGCKGGVLRDGGAVTRGREKAARVPRSPQSCSHSMYTARGAYPTWLHSARWRLQEQTATAGAAAAGAGRSGQAASAVPQSAYGWRALAASTAMRLLEAGGLLPVRVRWHCCSRSRHPSRRASRLSTPISWARAASR